MLEKRTEFELYSKDLKMGTVTTFPTISNFPIAVKVIRSSNVFLLFDTPVKEMDCEKELFREDGEGRMLVMKYPDTLSEGKWKIKKDENRWLIRLSFKIDNGDIHEMSIYFDSIK